MSVLIPVQGITANEERRSLVLQQASGIDGQRSATESLKGMAINLSGNEGVESLNNRQG
jgi:hypothetical protein